MISALLLLAELTVIEPSRVFDGESLHSGWRVVVRDERIEAAGPKEEVAIPDGAARIELRDATLLPGLIEAHSHVLLHPYDEASWNDQVLAEPRALRVARATNHLRDTLLAGFTTIRDLGTEGAAYDDVGLKRALEQGILVGPRMLIATRAIVDLWTGAMALTTLFVLTRFRISELWLIGASAAAGLALQAGGV